jgi:hypothetical protein
VLGKTISDLHKQSIDEGEVSILAK